MRVLMKLDMVVPKDSSTKTTKNPTSNKNRNNEYLIHKKNCSVVGTCNESYSSAYRCIFVSQIEYKIVKQ